MKATKGWTVAGRQSPSNWATFGATNCICHSTKFSPFYFFLVIGWGGADQFRRVVASKQPEIFDGPGQRRQQGAQQPYYHPPNGKRHASKTRSYDEETLPRTGSRQRLRHQPNVWPTFPLSIAANWPETPHDIFQNRKYDVRKCDDLAFNKKR